MQLRPNHCLRLRRHRRLVVVFVTPILVMVVFAVVFFIAIFVIVGFQIAVLVAVGFFIGVIIRVLIFRFICLCLCLILFLLELYVLRAPVCDDSWLISPFPSSSAKGLVEELVRDQLVRWVRSYDKGMNTHYQQMIQRTRTLRLDTLHISATTTSYTQ